ncbi:MAG: hypothetical protein EOO40_00550 [Deltaproteobacteria bacterium]|nr:MAG: hypothetical protein EOO40_00550 [Deltaproteobacteria bacterium]
MAEEQTIVVKLANLPDLDSITSPEAINAVLDTVAQGAYAHWVSLVQRKLTGADRQAYREALTMYAPVGGAQTFQRVIAVTGERANSIEAGQPAYDMHDTLLGPQIPVVPKGSGKKGKHKNKQGGFYRSIPFRHQTPTSNGLHGAPMGSPYAGSLGAEAALELGRAVYKAAKKLSPSTGGPGQKIKYGSRLPAGLAPKLSPKHTTDIYASMYKQSKVYEKATGSQYVTFRTISTTRGLDKWQRKATAGVDFAGDTRTFTERYLIGPAFKKYLRGAFGQ